MLSIHLSVILLAYLSQFPLISAFDGKSQGGKKWAVIVAGAQGYWNYFSQANACHGYQMLRHGLIPAKNIIHLNYDDIANNVKNPVKNNLINTLNGSNVYDGCVIDYRGQDVTPELFMAVMLGNETGVEVLTGKKGKVLESGPEDEVFVYMSDHGGPGKFYFPNPNEALSATDLSKTLETMYQRRMYGQMVVYMDSCYSGSMFEGLLSDNISIYAVTSTNPDELGWMSCYDSYRKVYLSTTFSYTWLYTTDQLDRDEETFYKLYEKTYHMCTHFKDASHPQQYGNISFNKYFIDRFMGDDEGTNKSHFCETDTVVDEKILAMLANEFEFPFEEDVLSLQFLQRPPIDMGGVATLIRRLMSQRLSESDRESLKAQLSYSLKIKVMARELIKAVEENVIKSVENTPLGIDNIDRREVLYCYNQAMGCIKSQCPNLQQQQFPFLNRNFKSLINLCKRVGNEVVINAVVTATTKSCRVL